MYNKNNYSHLLSTLMIAWVLIMTTVLFILWSMLNVAHAKTELYNHKLRCLAEVVWRESRGEGYWGQLAVAQVVVNRAASTKFPNNICQVVFQTGQFTWTKTWGGVWRADQNSYNIARAVLTGKHDLKHFRALYFHAVYVNPNWGHKKLARIGNHIFYL